MYIYYVKLTKGLTSILLPRGRLYAREARSSKPLPIGSQLVAQLLVRFRVCPLVILRTVHYTLAFRAFSLGYFTAVLVVAEPGHLLAETPVCSVIQTLMHYRTVHGNLAVRARPKHLLLSFRTTRLVTLPYESSAHLPALLILDHVVL